MRDVAPVIGTLIAAACGRQAAETGSPAPVEVQADVVVVGSGPAGLVAAWEAQAAGATVIVLEREDKPGGGGRHCGAWYAAGTRFQEEMGIEDSPEAALASWAEATGGDPEDATVQAFVTASAETVEWFADSAGVPVDALTSDRDCGDLPRKHWLEARRAVEWFVGQVDDLRTGTEARGLARLDGGLFELQTADLASGDEGSLVARAVVVASGGFARDLDRYLADRPALASASIVFEANPVAAGYGLPLLDEIGAGRQNAGAYGTYVHAIPDPREGMDREALVVTSLEYGIVVDLAGERVADEDLTRTLDLVAALEAAPEQRLFAVVPEPLLAEMVFNVPSYNWADEDVREVVDLADVLAAGAVVGAADAAALAAALGVDPAGLADTLARYEELVGRGDDADFGKDPALLRSFAVEDLYGLELSAGPAKAFGGAATDVDGAVLDADGQPIAGLYAAGEAAGMLGTPAVGTGFAGSCTAVVWLARRAGVAAAARRQ